MFGGAKPVSQDNPAVRDIKFTGSSYGKPIPIVYGRHRLAGNFIYVGGFQYVTVKSSGSANVTRTGFGGRSPKSTIHVYYIDFLCAICEGPVDEVRLIYKDNFYASTRRGIGNTLVYTGTLNQVPVITDQFTPVIFTLNLWESLELAIVTPNPSLAYPGIAYVARWTSPLGNEASLPQYNFEVTSAVNDALALDEHDRITRGANPADIIRDLLTNPVYGAGFPAEFIGDMSAYEAYCAAEGFFLSLVLSDKRSAAETIQNIARSTNAEIAWVSQGQLTLIPRGDEARYDSVRHLLYLPPFLTNDGLIQPIYNLTDDDFLEDTGGEAIRIVRKSISDSLANYDVEYTQRNVAGDAIKIEQPEQYAMWLANISGIYGKIYTNDQRLLWRDNKPDASLRPSGAVVEGVHGKREARFLVGDTIDVVGTTNGNDRAGLVVISDVLTGTVYQSDGSVLTANYTENVTINGESKSLFVLWVQYADSTNPFLTELSVATPTPGGLKLRAPMYQTAIVDHKNDAFIESFGISNSESLSVPEITDSASAKKLATLMTINSTTVLNTYEFQLDWRFVLLEPMDVVTLTYPRLRLDAHPVRIKTIEEDENGALSITAEDFTLGVATAPLYNTQLPMPSLPDFSVDGGKMFTPLLFEPTALLTGGGVEVWIAIEGQTRFWGGVDIYVSEDTGLSYTFLAHHTENSTLGLLKEELPANGDTVRYASGVTRVYDETSSLWVQLFKPENRVVQVEDQLPSDAREFRSAFYIDGGSDDYLPYEIVAYENAELDSGETYVLTKLYRGGFSTPVQAHRAQSRVVNLDRSAVVRHSIPDRCLGKTLKYKFIRQNIFNVATDDWDSALTIDYRVQGYLYAAPLPYVENLTFAFSEATRSFVLSWSPIIDPRPVEYEVRKGIEWVAAGIVAITAGTSIVISGDGTYWVAPRSRIPQHAGRENDFRPKGFVYGIPQAIDVTGTALFPGNVIEEYDELEFQFGDYDALVRWDQPVLWNRMGSSHPHRLPYVWDEITQVAVGQYGGSGTVGRQEGAIQNDLENSAVDLAGTSSVELATDQVALDINNVGDWTMALWFKTSSLSASAIYLYSRGSNSYIGLWTGRLFWKKNGAASFVFLGEAPISGLGYSDSQWHNLIVSYDSSAHQLYFYIDGKSRGHIENVTLEDAVGSDIVYLGQKGDDSGYWPGLIDDFSMFRRAFRGPTAHAFYAVGIRPLDIQVSDNGIPARTYTEFVLHYGATMYLKFAEIDSAKLANSMELTGESDGTINGPIAFVDPGLISENNDLALNFNGSSNFVNHPWPYGGGLWESVTIECLIKPTALSAAGLIYFGSDDGTVRGAQLAITAAGGIVFTIVDAADDSERTAATAAGTIVAGTIQHIVAMFYAGEMKIYVDGALISAQAPGDASLPRFDAGGTFSLKIGKDVTNGGASRYFNGVIDEVAIYEDFLPEDRVRAHAQSALAGYGLTNMSVDPNTGYLRVEPSQIGYYHVPSSHVVELGQEEMVVITAEWDLEALLPSNIDVVPNFDQLGTVDTAAIKGGRSSGAAVLMEGNPEVRAFINNSWSAWRTLIPARYHGQKFDLRFRLASLASGVVAQLKHFVWRVDMPDKIQQGEIYWVDPATPELSIPRTTFQIFENVDPGTGAVTTVGVFSVVFSKSYHSDGKPSIVLSANAPANVSLDPLITTLDGFYAQFSGRIELIDSSFGMGNVKINWIATGY